MMKILKIAVVAVLIGCIVWMAAVSFTPVFAASYYQPSFMTPEEIDELGGDPVPPDNVTGSLIKCEEYSVLVGFAVMVVFAVLSVRYGIFAVLGMLLAMVNAMIMYAWKLMPELYGVGSYHGWVQRLTDQGMRMQQISVTVMMLYVVLNVLCLIASVKKRKTRISAEYVHE